jgi:hypothetical protein
MMRTDDADGHSPWCSRVLPAAFAATPDGSVRTDAHPGRWQLVLCEFLGGYQVSNSSPVASLNLVAPAERRSNHNLQAIGLPRNDPFDNPAAILLVGRSLGVTMLGSGRLVAGNRSRDRAATWPEFFLRRRFWTTLIQVCLAPVKCR